MAPRKTAPKPEPFTFAGVSVQRAAAAPVLSTVGRGESQETLIARSWLETSAAKRDRNGLGTPQEITVPTDVWEHVRLVMKRAAVKLDLSVDVQTIDNEDETTTMIYQTRPRVGRGGRKA